MMVQSALTTRPIFTPVVANFYKGLVVSVPLHLDAYRDPIEPQRLHEALTARYADERFVHVMPLSDPTALDDGYFDVQACNNTNRCELFVFARGGQAVLLARLDNLGKGAAGAAIQSMNVHLGLDEGLGLAA
jgi:N-acetyl-gamma-glutamyl-phosphate reductase